MVASMDPEVFKGLVEEKEKEKEEKEFSSSEVSVSSTPTSAASKDLKNVTEALSQLMPTTPTAAADSNCGWSEEDIKISQDIHKEQADKRLLFSRITRFGGAAYNGDTDAVSRYLKPSHIDHVSLSDLQLTCGVQVPKGQRLHSPLYYAAGKFEFERREL